jgi:pyruvate kinase
MPDRFTPPYLSRLIRILTEIRDECISVDRSFAAEIENVAPDYRASARNLLHYLGLRQHDIRDIQRDLASFGLSSLGRTEAHALAGIDSVLAALHRLAGSEMVRPPEAVPPVDFASGPALLARHTERLLGPQPKGRAVYIMVTMPTAAADSFELVRDLLFAGMDVMRVNCAHDDAEAWIRMVANLRQAEREVGRSARVLFDLAGPKLRTGPIAGGRRIVRIKPRRDVGGGTAAAARIWLHATGSTKSPPAEADAALPVDSALLGAALVGDQVAFVDARGKMRDLAITGIQAGSAASSQALWAEARKGAYIEAGTALDLRRNGESMASGRVGPLPLAGEAILLCPGDTLVLTDQSEPGRPAQVGPTGVQEPARMPCTLAHAFTSLKPGERIFFDDGRIGGVIRSASEREVRVEIQQARKKGSRLRADRGLNLPDSNLHLAGLTTKDLADLDVAVKHADIVGLSFVRQPEDLILLQHALAERGGHRLGTMLKIENQTAFEQLPRLLLVGLQSPPIGVMVARGDLAVEVGFDRLAEVQEEILWLSEAAHVPVIWATQVLENLAQKGRPSRAEVTDAAMSGRAECVMLNKGPHVVEAAHFLANVLHRMQLHQQKKRAMLRRLSVSELAPAGAGLPRSPVR